jgi:hypothetical protein
MNDDTESQAREVAEKLSVSQRRYILACGVDDDYFHRHGITANWALRHGIAATFIHFDDGRSFSWDKLPKDKSGLDYRVGGQRLTLLGLAVRKILTEGRADGE